MKGVETGPRTFLIMKSLGGCALAGAVLVATFLVNAGVAEERAVIDRELEECREIPPHEVPPAAIDVSKVIPLEARVLVERGDRAAAQKLFAVTKRAFSDIGIRVKTRVQEVDPPRQWDDGTVLGAGPDQQAILTFMKDLFGGRRPDGVDVVYFMTRHWAGGFADCIGGVRYADRAFAFGSIDYSIEGVIPAPTANEGVIAAHEIGHLLGAHHHYSNCVEALPQGAPRGDLNPCTTMSPFAATASGTFALLERSFVRRYAALYAKG